MGKLIKRCWLSPSSRPSFSDMIDYFERGHFEIVVGADTDEVRQYVRGVCDWEMMSSHSHEDCPRPSG
jgi:hypothetical protein